MSAYILVAMALISVDKVLGQSITSIVAGGSSTCALFQNKQAKCWGLNIDGQLGQGSTTNKGDNPGEISSLPVISIGGSGQITQIAVGPYHACAVLSTQDAKCWGKNANGQLGYGDTTARGKVSSDMGNSLPVINVGKDRKVKSISVGFEHTCAILDTEDLKCWGKNANGQLGINLIEDKGDNEVGDNLINAKLGSRKVKQVSCGKAHTCALLDNASVRCWGLNADAQLGVGDKLPKGDDSGEMDSTPAVNLGTNVTAVLVLAGADHSCAVTEYTYTIPVTPLSNLKCWGNGGFGALGSDSQSDYGDSSASLGDNLPYVDLGTSRYAIGLSVGYYFTCALLDTENIKCFGFNNNGRLGLGVGSDVVSSIGYTKGDMANLAALSLGTGRKVKQVSSGDAHTCALLDDQTVKCFGLNSAGQLGYGDTETRGDGSGEMGDALAANILSTRSPTVSPTASTRSPTKSSASLVRVYAPMFIGAIVSVLSLQLSL